MSVQGQGHSLRFSHSMTVFRVRSISFELLVGFTNNFARMSAIRRRCAMLMFEQGQSKVKVKVLN